MNDSHRPLGSKLAGASKNQCLEALSSSGQSVVPSLLLNLSLLSPEPLLCCLYWVCHIKKKTLSPKTKQSIRVWCCYLWTWKMTFLLFIVISRLAFTTLSRFSFYKRDHIVRFTKQRYTKPLLADEESEFPNWKFIPLVSTSYISTYKTQIAAEEESKFPYRKIVPLTFDLL